VCCCNTILYVAVKIIIMCFRDNITNRKYHCVQDLVNDVLLIYSNCELYNDSSSILGKEARRQKRSFNTFLNDLNSM
jgi:hypothetical protein